MTHHLVCALQGLPQLLSDLIELDYGVQTQVFFLFWAEYDALEFQWLRDRAKNPRWYGVLQPQSYLLKSAITGGFRIGEVVNCNLTRKLELA